MSSLTEKIGDYLDKYLQRYLVEGKVDDKNDFNLFYQNLSSTSRAKEIERLSNISDLHLISIADMGYGVDFGLPIAKNNPSSKVEIINPDVFLDSHDDFQDFFFNGYGHITFKEKIDYDSTNPEDSMNRLYHKNGVTNAIFKGIYADEKTLSVDSSPLVYHAERVNHLTQLLVKSVRKNNAGLVLQPFINPSMVIPHYSEDSRIEDINYNYGALTNNRVEGTDLSSSWSRLITACQMYYASKIADDINGEIFFNEDLKGVHYKRPMFYVNKKK